jgi:pimeloyl-ACP methyl ester carboxylesterase
MGKPFERTFEVQGRRIAARCWHDPGLPPLLALHGWLDNAATFDHLAPLLPDYHLVAMDFAGHGLSDHRAPGIRYHFVDHVDDVLAVVNALGCEDLALMGHSMGAGIATLFSAALPERVRKLVLIEGFGPLTGDPASAPALLRNALLQKTGLESAPRVISDLALAVRARMQGIVPVSEAAARVLCERGVLAVEEGYVWRTDRRLRLDSPIRLTEAQVLQYIAAITSPTLLVLGEQGLPFHQDDLQARIKAHPQLDVVRLAGGHHLHLDGDVAAVAAAVNRHLADKVDSVTICQ